MCQARCSRERHLLLSQGRQVERPVHVHRLCGCPLLASPCTLLARIKGGAVINSHPCPFEAPLISLFTPQARVLASVPLWGVGHQGHAGAPAGLALLPSSLSVPCSRTFSISSIPLVLSPGPLL